MTFVTMMAVGCGASSRRESDSNTGGQAGDDSRGGAAGDTTVTGGASARGGSGATSGSGQTGGTGSGEGGTGGVDIDGGTGGTDVGGGTGGIGGAGGEGGDSRGVYVAVDVHSGACALRVDGSIQCWGAGLAGVPRGSGGYERLALAQYGGCGLTVSNGKTECFSVLSNSFQPPPIPLGGTSRYAEIDMTGIGFLCGLTDDSGEVFCQGDGAPEAPVEGTFSQFSIGHHGATGTFSGCALALDGSAVCWTWDTDVVLTPTPDGPFRQIAVGGQHACAIDQTSSLVCWGMNDFGQTSPPSGMFDRVSSGDGHSCALASSGTVECWGDDSQGQSTPPLGVTFAQISAGRTATCGVTTAGWIHCWGNVSLWSSLPPEG